MSAPRQRRSLPAERQAEVQMLEMLGRRFGVQDPIVRRLIALTLRAAVAGHSCLDLARLDAHLLAGLDAAGAISNETVVAGSAAEAVQQARNALFKIAARRSA
jgi:hypothetical protein